MTEHTTKAQTGQIEETKVIAMNKQLDLGALVFEDSHSFADKSEQEIFEATKRNFCSLFKELFDLKRQQRTKHGGDGDAEILEYTKAQYAVDLPTPKIIVPRAKPVPKEKPKTKWEKFREEKGLPARKKRSRVIFDPITKDWVPRWGPNSAKKIEAKHEWLLEDKGNAAEGATDPFTLKRQQKKMEQEKEKMRKLKNDIHAIKTLHGKSSLKQATEILRHGNTSSTTNNTTQSSDQNN